MVAVGRQRGVVDVEVDREPACRPGRRGGRPRARARASRRRCRRATRSLLTAARRLGGRRGPTTASRHRARPVATQRGPRRRAGRGTACVLPVGGAAVDAAPLSRTACRAESTETTELGERDSGPSAQRRRGCWRMSQVPAATRALRVLRFLAGQPDPVTLDRLAARGAACRARRPTTCVDRDDRGGLRRPPAPTSTATGSGSRPSRWAAATRARSRCSGSPAGTSPRWSTRVGQSAHLAVLHGRDVLYVLEERAPGRPPLVTDVGVRLPAHLTASGRAILAALPASPGPRALPRPVGVRRPARRGPDARSARCARCSPRPGSAGTPSRRARSPRASRRSRPRCSTTTSTRWPGSRSPTPSTPASTSTWAVAATQACAETLTRRLGGRMRSRSNESRWNSLQ